MQPSRGALEIENRGTHEVHRLPYHPGLSDRLRLVSLRRPWLKPLRKAATFFRLMRQTKRLSAIPSRNFFDHAAAVLRQHADIRTVIVTGRPFEHFRFGYELKRLFPYINWIADYRDDWTTSTIARYNGLLGSQQHRVEGQAERRWVSAAAQVTCVSEAIAMRIRHNTTAPISVVYNGYDQNLLVVSEEAPPPDHGILRMTYNGTLYPTQPIEPFIEAVRTAQNRYANLKLDLQFPGLAYDPSQKRRVERALADLNPCATITERIPRSEVIRLMTSSDVLIMFAHKDVTGTASSKIFEYLALRKPVLLYPSDNDILEELLTTTGLGIICRTETDLQRELEQIVLKKLRGESITVTPNEAVIAQYSRRKQTERLAQILNELK